MNHAASPEEMKAAWQNMHMHNMADFILFALGMAARTNPDGLKATLETVYGTGALASLYKRACDQSREALQIAQQAKELLVQVKTQLDEVERRLDVLDARQQVIMDRGRRVG